LYSKIADALELSIGLELKMEMEKVREGFEGEIRHAKAG
jgi:hypothetical protein